MALKYESRITKIHLQNTWIHTIPKANIRQMAVFMVIASPIKNHVRKAKEKMPVQKLMNRAGHNCPS